MIYTFIGWVDIDLTAKGRLQAKASGQCLKTFRINPDVIYTSLLKRSINSLNDMNLVQEHDCPIVINSWRLNERHYGMFYV